MKSIYFILFKKPNNTYSIAHDCSSGAFADQYISQIISSISSKTSLSCFAEGTTYAISALTTDGYFCKDNTGRTGDNLAIDDGSKASCKIGNNN